MVSVTSFTPYELNLWGFLIVFGSLTISVLLLKYCILPWLLSLLFAQIDVAYILKNRICSKHFRIPLVPDGLESNPDQIPIPEWAMLKDDKPGFEDFRPVGEWILLSDASVDQMRAFLKATLTIQEYHKVKQMSEDVVKHQTAVETVKMKTKLLTHAQCYYWTQLLKLKSSTVRNIQEPPCWAGWKGFWLEKTQLTKSKICSEMILAISHSVPAILALCYLCDNDLFRVFV
jgi:hypothetical protein